MSTVPLLAGLSGIVGRYDVLFCDVWGVLHDGVAAFPDAVEALLAFRSAGGAAILISNAPRPAASVAPMLDRMGVPRSAYDRLITSGDMTRRLVGARPGASVHHIGPKHDHVTLAGLDIRLAGLDEAELVVCTGLFDDRRERPEDYRGRLEPLAQRGVPLICANPDFVVDVGGVLLHCAGAIADLYRDMGGETVYAGKPYEIIYEAALEEAQAVLGGSVPRQRVLAIGDALRTDIAGAARFGVDALFVASGIHAAETAGPGGPDPALLAGLFARNGARPIAAQWRLTW